MNSQEVMNYDKPKLRDYKHKAPYISIWYSLVIHALLFIIIINLAKSEIDKTLWDLKDGFKDAITGLFNTKLSPNKSMLNELFIGDIRIKYDKPNIIADKSGT